MGTRNLTIVKHNGEVKVAQYGQWDGYPEGQGATVYGFVQGEGNLTRLTANLDKCRWATEADYDAVYRAIGADESGFMTLEQSDHFERIAPALHRNLGAEVLSLIANANGEVILRDESEFLADTLFCEWAYALDLDNRTLAVYEDGEEKSEFSLDAMPSTDEEFFRLCYEGNLVK